MKKILVAMALFFLLQAATAPAQDNFTAPTDAQFKKMLADFDQYAAKARADWQVPGMAVGIVRDGKLIFAKGYGEKTLGGNDPVTENTIFQIGSTSKAFTATVAAMLVDEGKFKWNDKVVDHLPDFMMYDPWVTREFQVAELMEQHSGMPGYAGDTLYMLGFGRPYIEQSVRYIKPVTSFRTTYAYQNSLWLSVAEIIEKYSKMNWEEVVKERIFTPLGMSSSSADMQSFLEAKDVSALHAKIDGKISALPKDWEYLGWSYTAGPAGAINSNIVDMAKWLIFQIDNGKRGDKQLVSEENMRFIHSPKTIIDQNSQVSKGVFYCLGWIYQEHSPSSIIWHNGGTLMKTMIAYVPQQKIGVVVLSNYVTELPELLALRFIDQYAGKTDKDTSAEALEEMAKVEKKKAEEAPAVPQNPVPAQPLETYAGDYASAIYGKLNVSVADGKLNITLGPKKAKLILEHWNGDVFSVKWPFGGDEFQVSFAAFSVDPQGKVTGVDLDDLDQDDGLGIFKRVE